MGERVGFEQGEASQITGEELIDFAAIKFQRENTLLTNAENYAASIREEAELYVGQLRKEVEALNQEAETRYEEAQRVKEEAEQDAAQRIEAAEAQIEAIRSKAHQEGFEAGHKEGLEKRYEEAAGSLEQIETALQDITNYRRQVNVYMEKEGIRLAVLVAKKIVQQELKVNKQVILKLLARTLSQTKETGEFRVWLNPQDLEFATAARKSLEKYIGDDQRLTLRPNPDLPVGSAQIETDQSMIDLTLAQQFHHIESQLYGHLAHRESTISTLPKPKITPPSTAKAETGNGQEGEEQSAQQGQDTILDDQNG